MELADFRRIEQKWQARWAEAKAFEPGVDAERQKFFFTIPYPYVTGNLHVGHGRTYTNGDVIARFKRMRGFNVLWPMGFHITGTPVLAVCQKIKANDAATVKLYMDYVKAYEGSEEKAAAVVKTFTEPWNVVNYFAKKLVNDFSSMGYSLDLSRQFTTGDAEYNKFVEWQFLTYKKKGYLTQAAYPILYCLDDQNAVGEDDIQGGDEDAVEVQKFSAFKFKLPGELKLGGESSVPVYLVSATLRADTAFGITNVFVNPDWEYAVVDVMGAGKGGGSASAEKWIVHPAALVKLNHQGKTARQTGSVKGESLVGETVETPVGARVPVLPAGFMDANTGTGVVHSVPAHAPFDWMALEDLKKDKKTLERFSSVKLSDLVQQIKPIGVIETPGFGEFPAAELVAKYKISNQREKDKLDKATKELYKAEFYGGAMRANCGEFAGRKAGAAKDAVAAWLAGQGRSAPFYETSRPATCRCGGSIIVAVLANQWFIDFNAAGWKDHVRALVDRMLVVPPQYKKQFLDTVAWLDKRPAARRRGLGTRLPFDGDWIIESLSDSTIYMAFYTIIKNVRAFGLKPAQLTPAFFDFVFLGKETAKKVAAETGASADALDAIRAEFNYWYPNDLRHTGTAHITNHLTFFLFAHAAAFGPAHWPRGVSLNELLISEGTKMSKSKGNVVTLHDVKDQYGVDAYRLYSVGAADAGSVLDFRKTDVQTTGKSLARFYHALGELAALSKQEATGKGTALAWMESKFERAVRDATAALEEFRLRDYVQTAFHGLLNHYEHFKRRAAPGERAAFAQRCAARWIALLAPVVPHACEELWEKAGGKGLVSLAAWPHARLQCIRDEAERAEDYVAGVAADARNILGLVERKGGKTTRVKIIVARAAKQAMLEKAVTGAESPNQLASLASDEAVRAFAEKNFYAFKAGGVPAVDEHRVLADALAFLSSELGKTVSVEREEESTEEKAKRAVPLKPAIVVS